MEGGYGAGGVYRGIWGVIGGRGSSPHHYRSPCLRDDV